ncbi:Bug family tripartite tricarboxylate transporter substrate binding protein [Ramlibacter sp.]|uniref:Bug family tripartite tricarboxylate transporter substrate binding protein n=1 Tax=Ramlibacter sp. TaxID=1917967 RepID=UPI0035B03B25
MLQGFRRRVLARWAGLALIAATGLAATGAAWSQAFPSRPIRIIVPYTPGGTTDVMARAIGQKLTDAWGQPVIVDNRPGAAGWLGLSQGGKSTPDGYTIVLTISNAIYAKSLYSKLPFDIDTEFAPISMLSRSAIGLAVPANFPAATLEEFIAHARRNPGKLSYGSFGQGTTAHIFGESLNLAAKVDLAHAAYKGAAPLTQDLLGGQISAAWLDTASLAPMQQAGKVRTLAITGLQRNASLHGVPTFTELGLKGFEPVGFFLVLAPAGTPKEIVAKLSEGIGVAIRSPDLSQRLRDLGQEPVGSTAEELGAQMKVLADTMDRTIKAAKIRVEQ